MKPSITLIAAFALSLPAITTPTEESPNQPIVTPVGSAVGFQDAAGIDVAVE